MIDFTNWTAATGDLKPGQQAVFLDVLNLVADGKAHLVWGADYRDGKPCLVNAVGQMLSTGGGEGIPMQQFGEVVSEFDRLNGRFLAAGINTDGYVSPLAADILIRNFGEIKEMDLSEIKPTEAPYIEPSDAQMMEWLNTMAAPAPEALAEDTSPEAEYVRSFVERDSD